MSQARSEVHFGVADCNICLYTSQSLTSSFPHLFTAPTHAVELQSSAGNFEDQSIAWWLPIYTFPVHVIYSHHNVCLSSRSTRAPPLPVRPEYILGQSPPFSKYFRSEVRRAYKISLKVLYCQAWLQLAIVDFGQNITGE